MRTLHQTSYLDNIHQTTYLDNVTPDYTPFQVDEGTALTEGSMLIQQQGRMVKPVRLPNGLYKFR